LCENSPLENIKAPGGALNVTMTTSGIHPQAKSSNEAN